MYYIYILRCAGGELYTGIATDPERRMKEHFSGGGRCAKYTRSHPPKQVETVFETDTKSSAAALEYRIKKLPKNKKEQLIKNSRLEDFFADKLNCSDYVVCPHEFVSYLNKIFDNAEKT